MTLGDVVPETDVESLLLIEEEMLLLLLPVAVAELVLVILPL